MRRSVCCVCFYRNFFAWRHTKNMLCRVVYHSGVYDAEKELSDSFHV